MSIQGYNIDIRRHGIALIACIYVGNEAIYGEFTSYEAILAWVSDMPKQESTENTVILNNLN